MKCGDNDGFHHGRIYNLHRQASKNGRMESESGEMKPLAFGLTREKAWMKSRKEMRESNLGNTDGK